MSEGANAWTVFFPDYFTASSIYFHMTEKDRFVVKRYDFVGLDAVIPVTVYSDSKDLTQAGLSQSQTILTELEQTYGNFAHPRVVIYVTGLRHESGMEYAGATMCSLDVLGHELMHSYFARGVMPANGNAGWIDEAVASWRDHGYQRASARPSREPVNLGGFSLFRRQTTFSAYKWGRQLISEFDHMFGDLGGMRPILRQFFSDNKFKTVTNDFFKNFLETTTGIDLTAIFDRYVMGRSSAKMFEVVRPVVFETSLKNDHPRPYTEVELALYR